jgi:Tol biopolymer transport system component
MPYPSKLMTWAVLKMMALVLVVIGLVACSQTPAPTAKATAQPTASQLLTAVPPTAALTTTPKATLVTSPSPPPPTPASLPSTVGWIAFTNGSAVSLVDTGSGKLTHLADGKDPAWSPDGRQVAFARQGSVYVMYVDGSGLFPLATIEGQIAVHPRWSPDGEQIAFWAQSDPDISLRIANADGSQLRTIFTGSSTWRSFTDGWSLDGQHIVYAIYGGMHANIAIAMSDRSFTTRQWLTKPEGDCRSKCQHDFDPVWSPDGQHIAFVSTRDGDYEIYIMKADGTNQTRLTNNVTGEGQLVWSPDGQKIAFICVFDPAPGNREICLVDADGKNYMRLTNDAAYDISPSWSPDGKRLAFASNRDGNYEIYIMNADGGESLRLTNNTVDDVDPVWSPQLEGKGNE